MYVDKMVLGVYHLSYNKKLLSNSSLRFIYFPLSQQQKEQEALQTLLVKMMFIRAQCGPG